MSSRSTAAWLALLLLVGGSALAGTGRLVVARSAGRPLGEVLPEAARQAGRTARCGPNSRDRRLFLFAQDRLFSEVVGALQAFLPEAPGRVLWFPDGAGHTLDEDRASVEARERQARAHVERLAERRRAALARMREWAGQRPAEDSTGLRNYRRQQEQWLAVWDALPPAAREAALRGKGVLIPLAEAGPGARRVAGELGARAHSVEVRPTGPPERPSLTVVLVERNGGGAAAPDLLNEPRWSDADGPSYSHLWGAYRDRPRGPRNAASHAPLRRSVPAPAVPMAWRVEEALEVLSKAAGRPLIGDYDPCYFVPTRPARRSVASEQLAGRPVWQALDIACREFDLDWDYRGGWLWVRSPRTVEAWAGILDLSPPDQS